MQILIEAGTFEEFKPKDWQIFFKVFSKKFEAVTDRIERLENQDEGSVL
jgi:hypothetical protein